jgi:hypothetical protein
MNVVRLRVKGEKRGAIFEVLNEREIDFVTIPTENDETIVECPIPTDALENLLDATREVGLDDKYIIVLDAMNVTTPHMNEL